jgi:hypothetical protein
LLLMNLLQQQNFPALLGDIRYVFSVHFRYCCTKVLNFLHQGFY